VPGEFGRVVQGAAGDHPIRAGNLGTGTPSCGDEPRIEADRVDSPDPHFVQLATALQRCLAGRGPSFGEHRSQLRAHGMAKVDEKLSLAGNRGRDPRPQRDSPAGRHSTVLHREPLDGEGGRRDGEPRVAAGVHRRGSRV
jgi:hypothetical protein